MEITVEEPRAWARKLTIRVPADRVQKERDVVLRRLAQQIKLPGFRKGKVPRSVVEQRYGATVEQETLERVLNTAYRDAIQQEQLQPITQGSIDNVDYEPGSDLTFDVEVEVRPEIELSRLGGFEVEQRVPHVGEAEVERVLERLREEQAVWRPVEEGAPEDGDRVDVQITPMPDEDDPENVPKPRQYEIQIGQGEALPEVEAAIGSLSVDEEEEFTLELPEQPADTEAEGEEPQTRSHQVRIHLKGLKRAELPELDDAFAQGVADVETLDELRERIEVDLRREAERDSERELRRALVSQLLEANPFDVPDSMIRQYVDRLIQADDDADPAEIQRARESAWPVAKHAIRRMLVVERIAETEGLRATTEDVDARIQEIAERNERSAGEVRRHLVKSGRMEGLEDEITEEKVFDYLKSLSEVREVEDTD